MFGFCDCRYQGFFSTEPLLSVVGRSLLLSVVSPCSGTSKSSPRWTPMFEMSFWMDAVERLNFSAIACSDMPLAYIIAISVFSSTVYRLCLLSFVTTVFGVGGGRRKVRRRRWAGLDEPFYLDWFIDFLFYSILNDIFPKRAHLLQGLAWRGYW